MTNQTNAPTTIDRVVQALSSLDYPASKWDIVKHAEEVGASEDAVSALRALPLADYRNEEEVMRSVPLDAAAEHMRGADFEGPP